nr:unnamed protein product [Spirometra erinaceieuropaei]
MGMDCEFDGRKRESQIIMTAGRRIVHAPYPTLKAEILRLNSVSDRQRYHQLLKEESMGERKPSELLRRMRSLLGDMQDFAGALFGKAVFSKIDLVRTFHQTPVAPKDIPKTAVITPVGLFELIRMPFRLRNAAQTFQSRNEEEHKEHLALVFDRLDKFGLVINPSKCVLDVPSLEFLGHQVDSKGLRSLLFKVEAVGRDFTVLTDHKPLTFAHRSHSDKYNPSENAHLNYISQFTTDIRRIDGTKNEVADMLSRPSLSSLQLSRGTDLCDMAAEQQQVGCPGNESVSGL